METKWYYLVYKIEVIEEYKGIEDYETPITEERSIPSIIGIFSSKKDAEEFIASTGRKDLEIEEEELVVKI